MNFCWSSLNVWTVASSIGYSPVDRPVQGNALVGEIQQVGNGVQGQPRALNTEPADLVLATRAGLIGHCRKGTGSMATWTRAARAAAQGCRHAWQQGAPGLAHQVQGSGIGAAGLQQTRGMAGGAQCLVHAGLHQIGKVPVPHADSSNPQSPVRYCTAEISKLK